MHPTTLTANEIRRAIDDLLAGYGATVQKYGRRRFYRVPLDGRGYLQVETHVRGPRTTDLGFERWSCLDAPRDIAGPWLEANVRPAAHRWAARGGSGTYSLGGGAYAGTSVPTEEAVDILAAWLPEEIKWQKITARRLDAEFAHRRAEREAAES